MEYIRRWPWIAQQEWHDVLFMHWPVPYDLLKPYVPNPITLETFEGEAWISIILFRAEKSRPRYMPSIISYPSFLQMNIRTYVHFDGEPGIYFLSVDVNRLFTMVAAKRLLQLPYELADMKMEHLQNQLLFSSKRINQNHSDRKVIVKYRPLTNKVSHRKGTLSYWLTERYCFWMMFGNRIVKGPLSHEMWTLYHSELDVSMVKVFQSIPQKYLHNNPLAHYAKSMVAYLHPFEQIGIYKR